MHGAPHELAHCFGALIDLQPIAWTPFGLVCAPGLDPQRSERALRECPLPFARHSPVDVCPDSSAALVAGWYRRSTQHAPAPPSWRELVQVAGEGFGPADHPTTAMCLSALDRLPRGAAVDIGCGSGLLSQAWIAAGYGSVHGIDADPLAVRQASASLAAAGHDLPGTFTVERIETYAQPPDAIVFANLPPVGHAALRARLRMAPRAIVLSGTDRRDGQTNVRHYRGLGMRWIRSLQQGRWTCDVLMR